MRKWERDDALVENLELSEAHEQPWVPPATLNPYDLGKAWVWNTVLVGIMFGLLRELSGFLTVVPGLLVTLLIVTRRKVSAIETYRLKPIRMADLLFPASFAVSICCLEMLAFEVIDYLSHGALVRAAEVYRSELPGDTLAVVMLFTVIVAPLAEELYFRGFFMSSMAELGPGWAVVFPSILFAIAHSPPSWPSGFVAGAAWSIFVMETGSLAAGIVGHATTNLFCMTLPLIYEVLPGAAGDIACVSIRIAGVGSGFFFLAQYRRLWASFRGYWADFRSPPGIRARLGYLLKHWSYKVILVMLILSALLPIILMVMEQKLPPGLQ